MTGSEVPVVKDLVLVGGGHSHVTVLKRFGMEPLAGVRLTLICRDVHTPYSGMLPGMIAGHYSYDEAHIDLGPLSQFARARFYHDEVVSIDPAQKLVYCRQHPPAPYDVLSINTGSTPSLDSVPGAAGHVVPVKPIHNFMSRWEQLVERVVHSDHAPRIAVVGAGAGGVELTLAAQYRLRRLLAGNGAAGREPEMHLFSAAGAVLPSHNRRAQAKFDRVLRERRVEVHLASAVAEVFAGGLRVEAGESYEFDEILWVTNAAAPRWPAESGLSTNERGFIAVRDTLQTLSHAEVFAAGDVAAMAGHPREKAGVFAVRQGPPLERNLRRLLQGKDPLPFQPQKKFLSLISTGDRYAVASRGGWSVAGAWVWKWKDWIDRRFMAKYNELPEMEQEAPPQPAAGVANEDALRELSTLAMRCGGCGAKVGATVLDRVLASLPRDGRPGVCIGLDSPDDAAVLQPPPGKLLVQSVDFFRAICDDPYVFGGIAANHCLNDLFAMGAEPHSALAVVTVPYGVESKTEQLLRQLLLGAGEKLREAGAALAGGHSGEGAELALGFAVNGWVEPEGILRKNGMRPGDVLILTKPLGTGTLFAANMRLKAKGRWIAAAIESMLQSNRDAADCLRRHGATACTDISGFGLLGHLLEMCKASNLGASLQLSGLPVLDGARETVAAGIFSSLQPQNLRLRRAVANPEEAARRPEFALLFDPQTAGGLLASLPAENAAACREALRRLGYRHSRLIGAVREQKEQQSLIVLEDCFEASSEDRSRSSPSLLPR